MGYNGIEPSQYEPSQWDWAYATEMSQEGTTTAIDYFRSAKNVVFILLYILVDRPMREGLYPDSILETTETLSIDYCLMLQNI